MKKCTVLLSAFFFLTCAAAYSQSLGDLAREEQKRRDAISEDRIITLENAPPAVPDKDAAEGKKGFPDDEYAYDETEDTQNDYENADGEESEYPAEESYPDAAANPDEKTESYWRNTMSEARNRIKQLENEKKELSSLRNALQSQHNKANGSRRGPIKNEIDKTRQAQDLNDKNLEQARKELQSLQNSARSSGALPGWIE